MSNNVLILERSGQNLKNIGQKGKTVLEGVFAEFGKENRNGRIYEEKEYLPHLEYLKKDIKAGNLLGELDHPERFEVALGNVSHRISELWYDQNSRQVKGRIEILNGTPKGQVAKALLDSGVPLSISSRAAGSVNEDKTVSIQQIYTYDLVAKPGFESAQLQTINESAKARVDMLIQKLNESTNQFEKSHNNILPTLGIVNENISMYDLSDKFPQLKIRPEAKNILKSNNQSELIMENKQSSEETYQQQWSLFVKNEFSIFEKRLNKIENAILESTGGNATTDIGKIKKFVNKLSSVQEGAVNWQQDMAKAINKVATYSENLAKKHNKNVKLTKKLVETVDYNAQVTNKTQDWVGHNAKILNAAVETVDFNATMQNGMNEWMTQIAKGVNALNEWSEEKAVAINGMHDWTSSIAKNLNATAAWTEEKISESLTKSSAKSLVEWIELIEAGKNDPKLLKKINETLKNKKIEGKTLNETLAQLLPTITEVKPIGGAKPEAVSKDGKESGVEFDEQSGTIIKKKAKSSSVGKNQEPKEIVAKVPKQENGKASPLGDKSEGKGLKGIMVLNTKNSMNKPTVKITGDGPSSKLTKGQNLKLNTKAEGKMNEKLNKADAIVNRQNKLNEKLDKIMNEVEKEKAVINESKVAFPFIQLLSLNEQKEFAGLSKSEKEKIGLEIAKHPTNDSNAIKRHWDNALTENTSTEPLWLKLAPKKYKDLYEKANTITKEAINAKSNFFRLDTPYQIEDFWQKSGLNPKPLSAVNEALAPGAKAQKMDVKITSDDFVNQIGEQMKKFNR